MRRGNRKQGGQLVALAVALGSGASAWSQEAPLESDAAGQHFEMAINAGAIQSDNVTRVADDESSGTIGRIGLDLAYANKTRRVDVDVDVNGGYETWPDDAYDDDFFGGGSASLDFGIAPERFNWLVQENFGQITANPFAADTPDNRENVNYFTTGPDFKMPLGSAARLDIAARYSDFQYELREVDGSSYGGDIAVVRDISLKSSLSLNFSGDRYDYDESNDYDQYQAYLRYAAKGSRTQIDADLGYTRLDVNDESPDGMLARVSLVRRIASGMSVSARFGTEYSSSGNLFREGQEIGGVGGGTSDVVATADPFTSRYASIGFELARHRTVISMSVRQEQERYEAATTLDRDLTHYNLLLRRSLSPVLELSVFGEFEQQDYENLDFESDDTRAGAFLNWQLGRRTALRFQYDYYHRGATDESSSFAENRLALYVIWSPVANAGPNNPLP
jgi:hypothetical protein